MSSTSNEYAGPPPPPMKLWLVLQYPSLDRDGYQSAVIAAATREAALLTHPSGDGRPWDPEGYHVILASHLVEQKWDAPKDPRTAVAEKFLEGWAPPYELQARHIGDAVPWTYPGVVIASHRDEC